MHMEAADDLLGSKARGGLEIDAQALAAARRFEIERAARVAAEAAERRNAFLAQASHAFAASLDRRLTAAEIARQAVPPLADIAIVDLVPAIGTPERFVSGAPDLPAGVPAALAASPPTPAADDAVGRVLRGVRPEIGRLDAERSWAAVDTPLCGTLRALGPGSFLALPLQAGRRRLGVLSLISRDPQAFDADAFALAGEYARRASVALDSAVLFESAVDARAAAEAATHRFEELVQGLDAVVWEMPVETDTCAFVSARVAELLGYSAAEWREPEFRAARIAQGDRALVTRAYAAARAGLDQRCEYRVTTADGGTVWVRDLIRVIRAQDRPARLLGVMVDITAHIEVENSLRERDAWYRSVLEESRDAIYVTARDGRLLEMNRAALELFGYEPDQLAGVYAQELYADPADRARFQREIESAETVRDFAVTLRTRSGRHLECVLNSAVRRDATGEIVGYQGIIRDVSAHLARERRLQESELLTRTVLASVQEGVIVFDRELRCTVWNRYMETLTGLSADDVVGRPAADAFPYLGEAAMARQLAHALAGTTVQSHDTEYRIPTTGRFGWIAGIFSPHYSADGEILGVVALIRDVTECKRNEDRLIHSAFHDPLTGLPNRALFFDRLERLIRHGERHRDYVFGVMFLDVDRFKVINDSLGHLAGDELLVDIARRVESCLRAGDSVARLGGDEFALLLDDVSDANDVYRVAERLLKELAAPFRVGAQDVFTTASIGIALSSTGYERPEDVLRDADTALYRAKAKGRSRYELFDREMHRQAVSLLQLETDLRRALERDELLLHYQPIFSLHGRTLVAVEALVRWAHPQRGLLSPVEFIPLAEETGLIVPIGQRVIELACAQLRAWSDRFPAAASLGMNVNVAARQFADPDLVPRLREELARTGIDGTRLRLELTESALLHNADIVVDTLAELRRLGVALCIDDFGTGYSSLNYLHTFPIDTLKIDRAFVGRLAEGQSGSGLVGTIVALGRSMGMKSVAEGVETAAQLARLAEFEPDYVQGYFLAMPMPAAEFETLLAPAS